MVPAINILNILQGVCKLVSTVGKCVFQTLD